MSFETLLLQRRLQVEEALERYLPPEKGLPQARVFEAMRYSLLGGGKRLRAILALEFCAAMGGDPAAALPGACALEMIHAYSLVHDDLPCMDDDDLRRGRPSNHIAFGEGMAVLAGDGLLTLAFETLSSPEAKEALGAQGALETIAVLSRAAGEYGMLGGQTVDVLSEGSALSPAAHAEMVRMKTGALICAAVHCGCIAAGADLARTQKALEYGEIIGLAYQMTDDVLDVVGDSAQTGKTAGTDLRDQKVTFVSQLGVEPARRRAKELFAQARRLLEELCLDSEFLLAFHDAMAQRES